MVCYTGNAHAPEYGLAGKFRFGPALHMSRIDHAEPTFIRLGPNNTPAKSHAVFLPWQHLHRLGLLEPNLKLARIVGFLLQRLHPFHEFLRRRLPSLLANCPREPRDPCRRLGSKSWIRVKRCKCLPRQRPICVWGCLRMSGPKWLVSGFKTKRGSPNTTHSGQFDRLKQMGSLQFPRLEPRNKPFRCFKSPNRLPV